MNKADQSTTAPEIDHTEVAEPGQESTSAIDEFREELYGAICNSGQAVTTANGLGDFDMLLKELLSEVLNRKAEEANEPQGRKEIDFL